MRCALTRSLKDQHRIDFEFALGKALEDRSEYQDSFGHYEHGNTLRLQQIPYSAQENTARLRRAHETFTADFFASRRGSGCPAADPIFIVGLPRAGSTLSEQILASHSQVEGTMELPDIPGIAKSLSRSGTSYLEAVAQLDAQQCAALGEQYLQQTRIQRRSIAP